MPYQFDGEPAPEEKLFVVLCHKNSHAICIKATSKTALFDNNPSKRSGCVLFAAGRVPCFPFRTVVEPDNQIPIPHHLIRSAQMRGTLEVSDLPPTFESDLTTAIENSVTLTKRGRLRILTMLSEV
jgi:hypothetical protein